MRLCHGLLCLLLLATTALAPSGGAEETTGATAASEARNLPATDAVPNIGNDGIDGIAPTTSVELIKTRENAPSPSAISENIVEYVGSFSVTAASPGEILTNSFQNNALPSSSNLIESSAAIAVSEMSNNAPAVTLSDVLKLSSASAQSFDATTEVPLNELASYYEASIEDILELNNGKENVDNLEHCDPVFPPPLSNVAENTQMVEDENMTEELKAQLKSSLEDTKILDSDDEVDINNEDGSDISISNKENKFLLCQKEIDLEINETLDTESKTKYTVEALPTAAALTGPNNVQSDENIKHEKYGISTSTVDNELQKQDVPIADAQIRQDTNNRFVLPIPTMNDLLSKNHATNSTTADEQNNYQSKLEMTANDIKSSPPIIPQPEAVQFPPSVVAQISPRHDDHGDPKDNQASRPDGDTDGQPQSRQRGRPTGESTPGASDPPPAPVLEFPPLPTGESFRVNDLGLSDGVFMFKYLGSFLSWMQPYDFPVELLRDALWKRVSVANLIGQSLPVEAGFLACLCVGVALALAVPLYALGHACCSLCSRRGRASGAPAPAAGAGGAWDDDASVAGGSGCRRRALLFLLDMLLMLMVGGVVAMFVTNEQLSGAVSRSPTVLHTVLGDASTFLRNTNLQLHFVVTKSLDRAVEAASMDLDNVETLLGKPIQRQLEEETGVGVALDALVDVTSNAQDVAGRVAGLVERAAEARGLALVAQERLADLRLQVDALRRQCPAKDRALCDTVEAGGLAVTMQLDGLLTDERLTVLRRLSEGNLSASAQQARGEFHFIPTHVEQQTRDARSGVRRQLMRQRGLLDDSAWALDALSRDLGARVEEARERAMRVAEAAAEVEYWRYMAAVGMAAAVLLLWTLLLAALSCGCCGAEEKARPTLFAWVGVLCPVYLALWAATLLALLVGGHGEVFVCRPLYDEPGFNALTALVDRPGVLFHRRGGFFSNLLYGNDSLDVPLRDVLRACEQNRPSYPAFRLQQVLDVDVATDHRRWEQLHRQLTRLDVDLTQLQLLTPPLQVQLSSLLNAALANLTSHRAQLTRPVTGKDLTTFADQLESVANQITDLATASRMETLASRTRRLLASHLEPLKLRKEDLVYQLTALEVQLIPLQKQVNQSLSHLKTIQFFINNQGANISQTKSRDYAARLVSYVQQYRDHVLRATGETVAPCKPVWDLFHAVRQLLCRHIMDPLNGFWFGALWCLLMLLAATPLAVRLAESYPRAISHGLLHRAAAETPPDPPAMPEQATWSTPGYVQKMYRSQSIDSLNNETYAMYEKKF